MAARKKARPWYRDLFFVRRAPRLRGIPLEWTRPDDDDAYERMIHEHDFISIKHWSDEDLTQYPIIANDLKDLKEYLLPTFFQFSQRSKYYQNRFYLYQWVFVIGAFMTTLLGAAATLFYIPPNATSEVISGTNWQQILSYATAAVGAVTAFTTALSNRGEPQKRWGKNRRLSEELRMHYFTYLSHMPPYDTPDRVQRLRENVINIRVKEQENV